MRRPINAPYTITTEFGVPDSNAFFGYHAGVDYGIPTGRQVYAPESGKVVYAQIHPTGGKMVVVFDGKLYHRLLHNSELKVNIGQVVTEGQVVALSGNTGLSTGPHLHWDINKEGSFPTSFAAFIDPAGWLKGEEMTTNREEAIKLYRLLITRLKHSPTDAEKVAWTGKNLLDILNSEYAKPIFAERKKMISEYPALKSKVTELTKQNAELTARLAADGDASKWQQLKALLGLHTH